MRHHRVVTNSSLPEVPSSAKSYADLTPADQSQFDDAMDAIAISVSAAVIVADVPKVTLDPSMTDEEILDALAPVADALHAATDQFPEKWQSDARRLFLWCGHAENDHVEGSCSGS